ncbi:DsbA family oxidoreductase [Demequina sp. SYSU T00039]|uniref:DsbA family oxidoreductase n=1 Tax=Demequina lignilytica TaxID=3051663 RepID=A0AAW7M2B9_9MICO|nr:MULTISPECIES: DsbA family oxidoreductase [unclassified Demequina]MDN4478810.1 DsbA family oxidoreductase [Demequina sp. SYSU T00039-1]MDN4488908.1 DsbA family oxidoreductase [Demequina sp. SYSU T00039]MDN4490326.1 DsbA family oxidoreductase [Demequina sp. SYSU T00068]
MTIEIEIWSDIACPWCYLGKRRLEEAISASGDDVAVRYRSFQLDPTIPAGQATPHAEALAKKFNTTPDRVKEMNGRLESLGAEAGIAYDFDRYMSTNTRDAHRVLHLAHAHGLGAQMKERLMKAQFSEGAVVSDADTLVALATEVGLDADLVRGVLDSDAYDADVQADIDQAAAYGATGVPFFVFDRAFAVSGAQPVETFALALSKAREARESATV